MDKDFQAAFEKELAEIRLKADIGEVEAQFHCFILLPGKAIGEYDTVLFDGAEEYLHKSANQRLHDALERLER